MSDNIINSLIRQLIPSSHPWLGGRWVIASATIAKNDIIYVDGVSSGLFTVSPADADAVGTSRGILGVASSGAASGGKLVMLPWRRVDDVDTSSGAVGDKVYLSGTAGGWSLSPGTFETVVGVVAKVDASAGAVLLDPNAALDALDTTAEMSLPVYNATGGALAAGTLVYVSGWDEVSGKFKIAKADANGVGTIATWVLRTAIDNSSVGLAYKTYRATGIDTSTKAEGDAYYLSETAGAGTITVPTAGGSNVQVIGRVATVAVSGAVEIDLAAHAAFQYLGNLYLQNGILSADSNGRALMATDYFNNATLLLKVADGAFVADASTRLLFADGFVDQQRIDHTQWVLNEHFNLASGATLPVPWTKDVQNSATGDYINDAALGQYRLATAAVAEAEAAQITFGDQLVIPPTGAPVAYFRVKFSPAGTQLVANERLVIGLCSAHTNAEDALDTVTSNIWFRLEGADLNIYVEKDDGTDVDDQDSTIDVVKDAWTIYKIDMTDLSDVKMYVDGVEQGGATLDASALTVSNLLQPIVCLQRDGVNTDVHNIDIDYVFLYSNSV